MARMDCRMWERKGVKGRGRKSNKQVWAFAQGSCSDSHSDKTETPVLPAAVERDLVSHISETEHLVRRGCIYISHTSTHS